MQCDKKILWGPLAAQLHKRMRQLRKHASSELDGGSASTYNTQMECALQKLPLFESDTINLLLQVQNWKHRPGFAQSKKERCHQHCALEALLHSPLVPMIPQYSSSSAFFSNSSTLNSSWRTRAVSSARLPRPAGGPGGGGSGGRPAGGIGAA